MWSALGSHIREDGLCELRRDDHEAIYYIGEEIECIGRERDLYDPNVSKKVGAS